MTSLYADRIQKYGKQAFAEAQFFHSALVKNSKGLRVLLPNEGLEFSDGSFIGTDLVGFFYYYNLDEAMEANRYESDTIRNPRDQKLCAWVKFYSSSNKLVGEILGDDNFGTVDRAGMKGFGKEGKWGISSADSFVEAHLTKDANSSTVTLDISKASHKVATMTTVDPELKASSLPDIKGHFHFDALDKISDGKYVSYSNNRLVFYLDDQVGTTFTGYFIPNGRSDNDHLLGIKGERELTLEGTRWT